MTRVVLLSLLVGCPRPVAPTPGGTLDLPDAAAPIAVGAPIGPGPVDLDGAALDVTPGWSGRRGLVAPTVATLTHASTGTEVRFRRFPTDDTPRLHPVDACQPLFDDVGPYRALAPFEAGGVASCARSDGGLVQSWFGVARGVGWQVDASYPLGMSFVGREVTDALLTGFRAGQLSR